MYVGEKPPAECFQSDEFGTPATCTKVGDEWVVSYDDGFGVSEAGAGMPGAFGAFFVLMLLAGVAFTIWKVSTARRMARDAGMSEGDATAMALLTDDGFEATYMASSVRGRIPDAPPATTGPTGTPSERLAELKGLLDQGLVTQDEHDAARRRILDGL
jgi:hypothetical protein